MTVLGLHHSVLCPSMGSIDREHASSGKACWDREKQVGGRTGWEEGRIRPSQGLGLVMTSTT